MNMNEFVPVDTIPAPAKANNSYYLRSKFKICAWRLRRDLGDLKALRHL